MNDYSDALFVLCLLSFTASIVSILFNIYVMTFVNGLSEQLHDQRNALARLTLNGGRRNVY